MVPSPHLHNVSHLSGRIVRFSLEVCPLLPTRQRHSKSENDRVFNDLYVDYVAMATTFHNTAISSTYWTSTSSSGSTLYFKKHHLP